ncbi:MAG TPA: enoyl-[acyl-carrier-protein] reductase [Planctomycetota bacterium]|jgi:enoyl-[acyl-carrier protein] reductase I
MLSIDLAGKRAFIAGVADDNGYGWAIAKAMAQAGASICVGTWPPVMNLFTKGLERGKFDDDLGDGKKLQFEKIYPLDASFDTPEDVPQQVREDKRYKELSHYTIQELADQFRADFGPKPIDIVVHSLANGPEVKNPLLETSRKGYLTALSVSAYSLVSMVQRFGPLMTEGGSFLSLSYLAADRVIPGYGGGMNAAKAAMESDARVLSFEAGRKYGLRVNVISAGPLASRAAKTVFTIDKMIDHYKRNSPLPEFCEPENVANAAVFLSSRLGAGITGAVLYVDNGFNIMGIPAGHILA